MFRLLFQYLGMAKPEWTESENIEHLREVRTTMLAWADNNNARFIVSPVIEDVTVEPVVSCDGRN